MLLLILVIHFRSEQDCETLSFSFILVQNHNFGFEVGLERMI